MYVGLVWGGGVVEPFSCYYLIWGVDDVSLIFKLRIYTLQSCPYNSLRTCTHATDPNRSISPRSSLIVFLMHFGNIDIIFLLCMYVYILES